MSDIHQQRRIEILANPTETTEIECKSWLDLSDKRHKATVAKAAIALANSGGGTIVFGVSEDNSRGDRLTCKPRPSCLHRYTSDAIGSAINTYADPDIRFTLVFENHPDTNEEHAFVEIPGGMRQPVFAKKGYFDPVKKKDVIKKQACYIRKPGPKSEEPNNLEWRNLLERCMQTGAPLSSGADQTDEQELLKFMSASKARWQERLDEVEEDDVACLRHGYWAFAFSIVGASTWPTRSDLRRALEGARPAGLRHRLFADVSRRGSSPYPAEESIEAWTANPEGNRYRSPYSCSFWRATLSGQFYHLEGFFEDNYPNHAEPGTRLYTDLSLQLHAMMLKLAARIARSVGDEAEIVICSEMTGLKGRYLGGSQAWWPVLPGEGRSSIEDNVVLQPRRLTPQQIDDKLVEILHVFLYPLYENFDFYDLKQGWVEAAVEKVKSDGW